MAMVENEKPMYNERVNEILRGLASGKTREELADEAGNTNWKSIDMYMRRKNFTWDQRKQTYVPKGKSVDSYHPADSSKAGHVISLLSKDGVDPRTVAERLGFKDHRELAQYMNTRGYVWDNESNNYVKQVGKVEQNDNQHDTDNDTLSSSKDVDKHNEIYTDRWEEYLPLLEMLQKNKERLLDLIVPTGQVGTIPRYIVPGVAKTKTVHMMNTLEQLVVDFSREKNLSQRELFEVALIEFFRKYGFEQEVERLLGS